MLEEAASLSIAAGEADQVLDELAEGIEQALAQLPAAVTEGWESDTIVDIIAERTARLRTGAALGDDNSAPRNRQARLDELSR